MKQLIHSTDDFLIVGLGDRAFVIPRASTVVPVVLELEAAPGSETAQPHTSDETAVSPREIQAVAVTIDEKATGAGILTLSCAVARYDKSLALYQVVVPASASEAVAIVKPTIAHKTTKRASCITFASIDETLKVVIAGDLAGDAVAFSLSEGPESTEKEDTKDDQAAIVETNSSKRLLLGHTASMLTGVHVVTDNGVGRILTADRDEKIRVSQFPNTRVIESFLLGHEAFVSSVDVTRTDGLTRCVTSSQDGTIRLWDYVACTELAMVSVEEDEKYGKSIPSRVALHPTGKRVFVIYDECPFLDIYDEVDGTLKRTCRTECAAQPLGLTMLDAQKVVVVCKDPVYLQAFRVKEDSLEAVDLAANNAAKVLAAAASIETVATILEKDKFGNLKMKKLIETRSSSEEKPWNNIQRKDTARKRCKRHKQNKFKRLKQEQDDAKEDEPTVEVEEEQVDTKKN